MPYKKYLGTNDDEKSKGGIQTHFGPITTENQIFITHPDRNYYILVVKPSGSGDNFSSEKNRNFGTIDAFGKVYNCDMVTILAPSRHAIEGMPFNAEVHVNCRVDTSDKSKPVGYIKDLEAR